MTNRIYRYSIPANFSVTHSIQMPKGGSIINLDSKSGLIFEDPDTPAVYLDFWVMFDAECADMETRHFVIVPTGKEIEDTLIFVGSVVVKSEHLFGGAVAYHVFEKLV